MARIHLLFKPCLNFRDRGDSSLFMRENGGRRSLRIVSLIRMPVFRKVKDGGHRYGSRSPAVKIEICSDT